MSLFLDFTALRTTRSCSFSALLMFLVRSGPMFFSPPNVSEKLLRDNAVLRDENQELRHGPNASAERDETAMLRGRYVNDLSFGLHMCMEAWFPIHRHCFSTEDRAFDLCRS